MSDGLSFFRVPNGGVPQTGGTPGAFYLERNATDTGFLLRVIQSDGTPAVLDLSNAEVIQILIDAGVLDGRFTDPLITDFTDVAAVAALDITLHTFDPVTNRVRRNDGGGTLAANWVEANFDSVFGNGGFLEATTQDMEDGDNTLADLTLITPQRLSHIMGANDAATGTRPAGLTFNGVEAALNSTGFSVTAIGTRAGRDGTTNNCVYIGTDCGPNNTGANLTSGGANCAQNNSGANCTFWGANCGTDNSGIRVTASGFRAAGSNSGDNLTAFGDNTSLNNTGLNVTSIGRLNAGNNAGDALTSIGASSALFNSGDNVTAAGNNSAGVNSGDDLAAFGLNSANRNSGNEVAAIGATSAFSNGGDRVTGVGANSVRSNSGDDVTGLGNNAANGFIPGVTLAAIFAAGSQVIIAVNHGVPTGDSATIQLIATTAPGGLISNTIYPVTATNGNRLVLSGVPPTSAGVGTSITLNALPLQNSTGVGSNSQPTAINQVRLGDANVTAVLTSGTITAAGFVTASDPQLKTDWQPQTAIEGKPTFGTYQYDKAACTLAGEWVETRIANDAEYDDDGALISEAVTKDIVHGACYTIPEGLFDKTHFGVMADDPNLPPEVISENANGHKQVDYVGLLLRLFADQQAEIAEMKTQIDALQAA